MHILRDARARRLISANFLFSVGSGLSMIAVPWRIVNLPHGDSLYGSVTLWTTLVLIALLPAAGLLVDRLSRRTVLQGAQLFGAVSVGACALSVGLGAEVSLLQLTVVYFCGFTVYTIYYPALFAFVQQIFDREQYGSLSGVMEVQGQTAAIVSGGLGALLVESVPLEWILAFDTVTYLAAAALLGGIPYRATHLESTAASGPRPGFWAGIGEAVRYLRERRKLAVFLLCSLLPFVGVMVGNYLWPVFVSRTLEAGPRVFALGEITFAAGAIAAGLLAPKLVRRFGTVPTIASLVALYTVAFATMAALPHPWLFGALMLCIGLGNAGSRVARNILNFHVVPNAIMGRVNSFYAIVDRSLRAGLIGVSTAAMPTLGPRFGMLLVSGLTAVALVGVLIAGRNLDEDHRTE